MDFMEKVGQISKKAGDAVSEACNNLAEKSAKYAEDCEMRCNVAAKEAELTELFRVIGEKVYLKYKEEKCVPVECVEEVQLANKLTTEVKELNEKLLHNRGEKECVKCNSIIAIDSVFCPICGKKQVTTKSAK